MSALPTRADYAASLRALADLFEATDLPMPTYQVMLSGALTAYADYGRDNEASIALMTQAAKVLGVELVRRDVGENVHHTVDREFGPVQLHLSHVEDGAAGKYETAAGKPEVPADEVSNAVDVSDGDASAADPAPVVTGDGAAVTPEHYHSGGVAGRPGENEAECACGVTFAGFDTHAEAAAALDRHIAEPSQRPKG